MAIVMDEKMRFSNLCCTTTKCKVSDFNLRSHTQSKAYSHI